MPLPLLDNDVLYTFTANQPVLPLCGFRSGGVDYIGLQPSAWESSERSWDNGDPDYSSGDLRDDTHGFGRWHGPGAIWVYANDLQISGKMETLDHDDIARVPSATAQTATWEKSNIGIIDATGVWRVILQSADGSLLHNATQSESTFTVPALSANAVLWVRLENATRNWQMPPDYLSVTGYSAIPNQYYYTEDDVDYIWDYIYDVGRRPTDSGNPLYDLYQEAFLAGQLQHYGAWTQYVADGTLQSGPWSALRIAIDSADFAVESAFIPAPGAVIIDAAGNELQVHPTACSVSVWSDIPNGQRIAGTIATTKGVAVAYWDFNSAAPELLAVSYNMGTMICESSLYPTPADIIQLADSRELLLTWSYLLRYDGTKTNLQDRLIGLPIETLGHPGGRCLRSVDGEDIRFFTEFFGGMGVIGETGFIQMYNTLRTLDLFAAATQGVGTAFHGNNCAEGIWGKLWGWVQDKPFSDETAKQYLAFIRNGMWEASSVAAFDASETMWQRVAKLAKSDGQRLICSGKNREDENAIWGINDGKTFKQATMNFRPRRLTQVTDENGDNWLYAIGRPVVDGDVQPTWQLRRLSGEMAGICFSYDTDAFKAAKTDVEAVGIDVVKLPAYLSWHEANCDGGGYWLPAATVPTAPYLTMANDGTTVSWALTGTAPYDFAVWGCICVTAYDDGTIGEDAVIPDACGIDNASDALAVMPVGTKVLVIGEAVPDAPWSAIQVNDACDVDAATGLRKMELVRRSCPCLWGRYDSAAAVDDLTTYSHRLRYSEFMSLPDDAKTRIQVCALIPPSASPVKAQVIEKR